MVDSLSGGRVKSEVDQVRQVKGDEQADFARGQAVVAHFALV